MCGAVCADAPAATVEELVGEARPLGIAQSGVEGSSGEAGSSWPRAERTPSAGITAVAALAGGARPTGIAQRSAATKPELAMSSGEARSARTESVLEESLGEAGSSGSRADGATSAATVAVARSDDEDRPSGIAKNSARSKGVAGSSWSRARDQYRYSSRLLQSSASWSRNATTKPELKICW